MSALRLAVRDRPAIMLVAVVVTEISLAIGRQSIGPLAPFLQRDLGVSRAEVGLFVSAIYLGATIVVIPSGWLADSLGVRRILLAGQAIVGAFVIATSLIPTSLLGLLFLFISGIGYGGTAPATGKAGIESLPASARGTAMSIKQTGVTVGGALSGALLPPLALALGWRLAFALAGAYILASGLVAYAVYPERPPARAAPTVAKAPLRTVWLNRNLLLLSVVGAIWAPVQVSFATYIVLFLVENLGVAVVTAGGLLALAQVVGTVGRLGSGVVSDRLFGGRRKTMLLLFAALMVVSSVGAGLLAPGVAPWVLVPLVAVFGLAVYGWAGIQMALVGELAGKGRTAMGIGLSLSVTFVGILVGPPLFGYVVDATHSYPTAWYSLAIATAVGTVLLLFVRETSKGEMAS